MPAHAVFQTTGLKAPLAAEPAIIVRTMTYVVTTGLRRANDTKNTPWMWTAYLCSYATKWMKDPFRYKREDTNEFYDRMIETAAIAAAACESVLRQRDMNGKTFYEPN